MGQTDTPPHLPKSLSVPSLPGMVLWGAGTVKPSGSSPSLATSPVGSSLYRGRVPGSRPGGLCRATLSPSGTSGTGPSGPSARPWAGKGKEAKPSPSSTLAGDSAVLWVWERTWDQALEPTLRTIPALCPSQTWHGVTSMPVPGLGAPSQPSPRTRMEDMRLR